MRPFGNEAGRPTIQPSSVKPMEGFFMSRIPNEPGLSLKQDQVSFLDPWTTKHDGIVPEDAQFVGAWRVALGIDDLYEALFLQRGDQQDRLWSTAMDSEESMRQGLIRHR